MSSDALQYYLGLDQSLFTKINQDWSFPAGDVYFPAITDFHQSPTFLYFVFPILLIGLLYKFRLKAVKYILALSLALAISDALCFRVIKPAVQRPRPAHAGMTVNLRVEDSGGNSFPSNHSSNIFATAMVTSTFFPFTGALIFVYAASVAYSRVYVGVHYPSDVLAGALLGILVGYFVLFIFKGFLKKPEETIEGKFDFQTRKRKSAKSH